MARRHHYKRRTNKPEHELDITTFLNLMVVLVPFLLITAVFSRLTIVELTVPSSATGAASSKDGFHIEVIVREAGIEVTNGTSVIGVIPNKDDDFDLQTLTEFMLDLKQEYPEQDSASVLMEAQIPYDYLIRIMDVVRAAEIEAGIEGEFQLVTLFSDISVGDAP